MDVLPVILCGGSGTRLWPLSRSGFPKQFLALNGNETLFQQALLRANAISNSDTNLMAALVVTNEEHRFLALDQITELGTLFQTAKPQFLLEPSGKNTAPALTLAALAAMDQALSIKIDPILMVTPADQTIQNQIAFTQAMRMAAAKANEGAIVVMGIHPTHPETGYGYIQQSEKPDQFGAFAVAQFAEKPNEALAKQYLASGDYSWNGGIFVLKASVWLKAIQTFRPDIYLACQLAFQNHSIDQTASGATFIRPNKGAFMEIPSESIDYAVIEKCPNSDFPIAMIPLDAGWSDLGAWDAVWKVGQATSDGNVISGDVMLSDTENSLVRATNRLVALSGVKDMVVVETADAVLVAHRNKSQDVKAIVSALEKEGREEKNLHRKVSRPWGWYDSVDEGERFKVKRIQVKPGASLSLQMHHHRAEHWIVVKGVAEVTNGDQVITLQENQSTYIPQGQTHRLANPGTEPLEIIEVQSGGYLGEDDIVRFEDTYGRK
jgi:mannose-1-phosphate guanylyltransferase/mannose-6-phosphate isomerase